MQDQIHSDKSELGGLSLRDLFYKYIRFLPFFVLSVAIFLLLAYAYLRYATPIYSAVGTMYIKSDKQTGASDKFEDIFVNDRAQNIQSEIEVLKSRPLMERVVQRLGLQFSYYAIGKFKSPNIYKQGPFLINALQIADSTRSFNLKVKFINDREFTVNDSPEKFSYGQVFKNQYGMFSLEQTPAGAMGKEFNVLWHPTEVKARDLASGVQVLPKTPGTGILVISLQATNPQMCADVINQLMEEYKYYSIEEKKSSSDSILKFIDARLLEYGASLDSAQRDLNRFQQENDLIDVDAQYSNFFKAIEEADKGIEEQKQRLSTVLILRDYLTDKSNEFNKVPTSFQLEDITLTELVTGYNTLQLERQRLLEGNVPPQNPSVLEYNGQIEKVRSSILENLRNIEMRYNVFLDGMKSKNVTAQTQIRTMPFKVSELLERKARVESLQNLFKYLQEKKEETSISRASTISSSRTVDKAFSSRTPVKPNRRAIQLLAIAIGLGLPALIIFIAEILNDKITTRADVERITKAPVLGEVGHSYSESVLVVNKVNRSMVAEQFRIIRSNLQYVLSKQDKVAILVTSSFSGEGKSFVSTNMGAVMSLTGKKTIILEFDIRKPKIISGLNMQKGPGITSFLVGKESLENLVRPVESHENLFVLGCGPVPPNPAELLLSERMDELFSWLRSNFDVVIVDTAPVGMVGDAMTLGRFVDCTLYLVRQRHTFKKQISLIDDFYQNNKLPKLSIIINDVKLKPGYGYYGYGRYGYGYGYDYGSYYEEEHPPKSVLERIILFFDLRRLFKKRN